MTEQLRLELAGDDEHPSTVMNDRYQDDLQALAERHDDVCRARYGAASPYAPIHRDCTHDGSPTSRTP
jgi:hypothetical protein